MESEFVAGGTTLPDVIIPCSSKGFFLRERPSLVNCHEVPMPLARNGPLNRQKLMLAFSSSMETIESMTLARASLPFTL